MYEYFNESFYSTKEQLIAKLNKYGKDRWEVVHIDNFNTYYDIIFKRKIES